MSFPSTRRTFYEKIRSYFDIAHGTFVWRMLPVFESRGVRSFTKMPRGAMRDSGLANFLLGISSVEGFLSHPLCGRIWEGFITEELLKNFGNRLISWVPSYFRTKHQAEIDLILDGDAGLIPIEIKLGNSISHYDLRSIKSFLKEHKCPLGLVVNTSTAVSWLDKNILQVPAGCL